ncbi:hypothetical protein [Marinobacter zhanjiangensis]|uniref:Lipoprotein n=1 Tax=Marinobacter zhanjiangensis TaxID=578215 RepID=A0ABQ3ANH4_9GAMM|nr:hypothetical protein [Marinobacter zhanjiangensis]GGY60451.1 hypothetical protein GCM10007071_03870 [Marinobacter zhanjiangensis]
MRAVIFSVLAPLLLSGCAGSSAINEPYSQDADHSRAYNLARSVGLDELEDVEVSRDQLSRGLGDAVSIGLDTFSLMDPDLLDLSFGSAFGMGLLFSMAEPTDQIKRHSIIAWVPESEISANDQDAVEAQALRWVSDSMTAATVTAMEEMGFTYELEMQHKDIGLPFVFSDYKTRITAVTPDGDQCMARFNVREGSVSKRLPLPDMIGQNGYGYRLNAGHDRRNPEGFALCYSKDRDLRELNLKLGGLVSENLPPTIFMYRPPVDFGEDGVRPPFVLDQGKSLLFVTVRDGVEPDD